MTSSGGHTMLCLAWQAATWQAARERGVKVALLVLAPSALGNISPCAFEEMLARMNLAD